MLNIFIHRRYTKFYGTHGDAAARIAHDAILGNVLVCTFCIDYMCIKLGSKF